MTATFRTGFTADWVTTLLATFDAGLTERLGELDRLAGDGDFGVNLAAACGHIRAAVTAAPPAGAADWLTAVSRGFLGVGGTSGPLFGMVFRDLARHSPGAEPTTAGLAAGFAAGLATVQRLGGAAVGDKTMVDALAPAAAALSGGAGLDDAAAAAIAGTLAIRDRAAHRGRAGYVGAASAGVLDPGAATAAVIVACAAAAAAGRTAVDLDWLGAAPPAPAAAPADETLVHVMFFSPRIPPNTGNAIRLVAATGAHLHLVRPLGFDLSEPKLRRAGLDYHDLAAVTVHESLPAAWAALPDARVFAFTTGATTSFTDVRYRPGDVLLFGPEPTGLDAETLADARITATVRIPMLAGRRSLNLSNAAAVAAYEAWRQHGFAGGV